MTRTNSAVAVFLLGVALLSSGCGGGGDAQLTKAEFLEQGNALCKKALETRNARYQANARSARNVGLDAEKIVSMFVLPSIREVAKGLDELSAPAGDQKEVDAIVAGIERGIRQSEAQIERDPEGFEDFLRPTEELARKYGLTGCAQAL